MMDNKSKISDNFGSYLYGRLPQVYRDYDVKISRMINGSIVEFNTLEEYIHSFADGGFKPLIEDLEAVISLLDPMSCPEEFLPLLLRHFGLDFVGDIPTKFQRRLVQNIVTLYRKKGTIPAISFLARELSGFDVSIEETERGGIELVLVKLSGYEDENAELLLAQDIIQRYIYLFLPANVNAEVVVTYGYSEGITINGISTFPEGYDHVEYNVEESLDDYFNILETNTEEWNLLERLVEEDFNNLKLELVTDNFSIYPADVTSLTNLTDGGFVFTNGITSEDIIHYNSGGGSEETTVWQYS